MPAVQILAPLDMASMLHPVSTRAIAPDRADGVVLMACGVLPLMRRALFRQLFFRVLQLQAIFLLLSISPGQR
jgi:hypothetical protein